MRSLIKKTDEISAKERFSRENFDVYEHIRRKIANNSFGPMYQLKAVELSDSLNVGITPVREALIRLSANNLIENIPNRGFFTKKMISSKIYNHYEAAFEFLKFSISTMDYKQKIRRFPESIWTRTDENPTIDHIISSYENLYLHIARESNNDNIYHFVENFNYDTHTIRYTDAINAFGNFINLHKLLTESLVCNNPEKFIEIMYKILGRKKLVMSELVKEAMYKGLADDQGHN